MQILPAAFASLVPYRQFIVCQFLPDPERPGKTLKYPTSPYAGGKHDAHDPAIWVDAATAVVVANLWGLQQERGGAGWGVGFVFTEADPFFFLDVDACLSPEGAWSPIAHELCAQFAGAAVEISQSGEGLHIIGTGKAPTDRRKKGPGFDLYTEKRFVALTGAGIIGDAGTEHSAELGRLTEKYLLRTTVAGAPVGWTDGPCPEWRGSLDDDDLIRRAMASQSAGAAFGAKASFADLWTCNTDALMRAYPDDQGRAEQDDSRADAALAQHLAFWTGKDCERMLRLMWRSGLVREKWQQREEYLRTTILYVVAQQRDVCQDKPPEPPPFAGPPPSSSSAPAGSKATAPTIREVTGDAFCNPTQQRELFAGCVYVVDAHRVMLPGGMMLKPEQFKALYGGYTYSLDGNNERTTKDAWEAFSHSQANRFPRVHTTCFRPEEMPGGILEEAGRRMVNVWFPVQTDSVPGDVAPFLTHLTKLLPDERDRALLTAYMCALVQFPGDKFQWWPVVQGCEGNGKTLILSCVEAAVGARYCHRPSASDLAGNGAKFNSWMSGKICIGIEEIKVGHRSELIEILKDFVTNDRKEVQGKGADQVMADNRANGLLFTNHKDGMPQKAHARRYANFYTAQQSEGDLARDGMSGSYFPTLYAWLRNGGYAHVTHWLQTYVIPAELSPAVAHGGQLHRAPATSSTTEALSVGLGRIEQEVMEAIEQGLPGFAGGWVSSMALDRLLDASRMAGNMPRNKRREMLRTLGYDYHPALPEGRVNNITMPDAGKPRLFVRMDSPARDLATPADVARHYTAAQEGKVALSLVA